MLGMLNLKFYNTNQILALLAALGLKYVSADYKSIIKTVKTFERDMFSFDPMNDNVLSSIVTNIQDYGCWCNFKDLNKQKVVHSAAPALDEFDEICKTLINGYSCGRIDPSLNNPGDTCDPTTQEYISGLNIEDIYMIGMFGDPVDNLKLSCEMNNPENSCARTACLLEGNFILNIFKIWNDSFYQVQINPDLLGSSDFDRQSSCPIKPKNLITSSELSENNDSKEKESSDSDTDEEHSIVLQSKPLNEEPEFFCCGSYPKVEPFKQDKKKSRACCGNKSYNTAMMCCEVGGEMKAQTVCNS